MRTVEWLQWLEVMDRVQRREATHTLNLLMAGRQLGHSDDGLRQFRVWLSGPRSKAAEELEEKYRKLQGMFLGIG